MDQQLHETPHTSAPRSLPEHRAKMPIAGMIFLLVSVAGFGAWTTVRVKEANTARAEVSAQRAVDAQRALEALKAVRRVQVITGVADTWVPVVEIDGTLAAARAADLGFKVGGRIGQVGVKVGDTVRSGQLLASLDSAEAGAQLSAARAQVGAAEAALAMAQDSERRTAALVQTGSAAEASGVQTTQQRTLAAAQLDAARAQVSLAQVSLSNHRLTAPFAGSVTRAPDAAGGVVGPGTPLFSLADLSTLKLRGTVSEQLAPLVVVGMPVVVDSELGEFTGTITTVLGTVDEATRRVRIEASVPNDAGKLRAGSFVRAKAKAAEGIDVLRYPHDVLRPGTQDEVLVVENGSLASRRVALSYASTGDVLVRHGLAVTDKVVVAPKPEDGPGLEVEIDTAAPADKAGTDAKAVGGEASSAADSAGKAAGDDAPAKE